MEEKQGLVLVKGGKLLHTEWVYDREKKKGSYVTSEVTNTAPALLFEYCDLAEDVTLKDIFLLLNTHLDIFDSILGNFCKAIVTEALTGPEPVKDTIEIEYLELYKVYHVNFEDKETYGGAHPYFGGIGFEEKEDRYDSGGNLMQLKGQRINWGVSFSKPSYLAQYPVKLNRQLKFYDDTSGSPTAFQEIACYDGISYTLGDILYGILWELSFYGNPAETQEMKAEIDRRVEEIKSGEAELIPLNLDESDDNENGC